MELQSHKVEFNEELHQYTVDGEPAISVTQLLSRIHNKKYEGVSSEVLKAAAEKGTELHNAIECYEQYGLERNDLIEFRNYKFLKKQFRWKAIANEVPILIDYNGTYICGTCDLVFEKGSKVGLGDFKRTSVLDKEMVTEQLNLYRIGYQQTYGTNIEELMAVHLREDVRKVHNLPINEEMTYQLIEKYKEIEND